MPKGPEIRSGASRLPANRALDAVNFFLADVRDVLGLTSPFTFSPNKNGTKPASVS